MLFSTAKIQNEIDNPEKYTKFQDYNPENNTKFRD